MWSNFWLPVILSIVYVLVFFFFFRKKIASGGLGEIGSFLGGIFTPLTFFWLILNNHQQFEDSRLNRDVLTRQVLVDERKSLPVFSYTDYGYWTREYNNKTFKTTFLRFFNSGATISDFRIYDASGERSDYIKQWKDDSFERFGLTDFYPEQDLPQTFKVTFTDAYGFFREYQLFIERDHNTIKKRDLKKFPKAIYIFKASLIPLKAP